jgi:hypothetical protein
MDSGCPSCTPASGDGPVLNSHELHYEFVTHSFSVLEVLGVSAVREDGWQGNGNCGKPQSGREQ